MEIVNEITKDVFERHVPSAKMPERNDSVFLRLQEKMKDVYACLCKYPLCGYVDQAESDEILKAAIIRLVCLTAFRQTARSLDLVLTATGFGIVSTQSTAPASQARVDALIEEIQVQELQVKEIIISGLIKLEGWGLTLQAKTTIPSLFYRPSQLASTRFKLTAENWEKARWTAVSADAHLRQQISDEYMDELMLKTRTNAIDNADMIVVQKCNAFTADYISSFEVLPGKPNRMLLDAVMRQVETYADSYPTYKSSRLYAARHGERYENKKEDPTFFFM